MVNVELRHHGTKGMKWGIRRFQRKDGSLTPLGRMRRRKGEGSDDSDSAKKEKKAKPKSAKEMTDDELKANIERLRLEKTYKDLDRDVNPQTVSRGKKFVNDFIDKAVIPGVTRAGEEVIKKAATKYGSKMLGVDEEKTKNTVEEMAKEVKDWKTKKDYDQMKKEQQEAREATEADKKAKDAGSDNASSSGARGTKGMKWEKRESSDSDDSQTAKTDAGKETVNKARKPSSKETIIDVDFTEVNEETVASGKSYALAILKELDK